MNKSNIYINAENRKRDARLEKSIDNFNRRKARNVMNDEDFERFQRRLDSAGGSRELYDICFGQSGDFEAAE